MNSFMVAEEEAKEREAALEAEKGGVIKFR